MVEVVERHKVRISVLKRFSPTDVFIQPPVKHVEPYGICGIFRDGQEFIVSEDVKMPEDFCTSAWFSIYPSVRLLSFGGDYPWYEEKGVAVNCCTDGLRPVVFKLQRI